VVIVVKVVEAMEEYLMVLEQLHLDQEVVVVEVVDILLFLLITLVVMVEQEEL
jgi:hypothetical protein